MMQNTTAFEGDETSSSVLHMQQGNEGFRVTLLEPGANLDRAFACIHQKEPALVLLDVHLSHFDGFDLLERNRADHPLREMRILMFSGMEMGAQSRTAGANGSY